MAKSRRAQTHKDVEFHVEAPNGRVTITRDFREASEMAVVSALTRGSSVIDVVIWSEAGARAYAGSEGVEQYREDPEASVFERYELSGNNLGRVP